MRHDVNETIVALVQVWIVAFVYDYTAPFPSWTPGVHFRKGVLPTAQEAEIPVDTLPQLNPAIASGQDL